MDIKTPREYFSDEAIKRHWNVLYGSKIGLDFCKEYADYYHQAKLKLLGKANVVGQSEQLKCPKCNSDNLKNAIYTEYKECNECYHYWEANKPQTK